MTVTVMDAEAGKCRAGKSVTNQARDEMRCYISTDVLRAQESLLHCSLTSKHFVKKKALPIIRNPILFQFASCKKTKLLFTPFLGCHVEPPSLHLSSYRGCICTENLCLCDFFLQMSITKGLVKTCQKKDLIIAHLDHTCRVTVQTHLSCWK